jgi:hypothetical protein
MNSPIKSRKVTDFRRNFSYSRTVPSARHSSSILRAGCGSLLPGGVPRSCGSLDSLSDQAPRPRRQPEGMGEAATRRVSGRKSFSCAGNRNETSTSARPMLEVAIWSDPGLTRDRSLSESATRSRFRRIWSAAKSRICGYLKPERPSYTSAVGRVFRAFAVI